MINEQLITLCRTIVAAIQESDGLDAGQLRKLFLQVVPQLLTEIEILGNLLQSPFAQAAIDQQPLVIEAVAANKPEPQKKRKARRKPSKKSGGRQR